MQEQDWVRTAVGQCRHRGAPNAAARNARKVNLAAKDNNAVLKNLFMRRQVSLFCELLLWYPPQLGKYAVVFCNDFVTAFAPLQHDAPRFYSTYRT